MTIGLTSPFLTDAVVTVELTATGPERPMPISPRSTGQRLRPFVVTAIARDVKTANILSLTRQIASLSLYAATSSFIICCPATKRKLPLSRVPTVLKAVIMVVAPSPWSAIAKTLVRKTVRPITVASGLLRPAPIASPISLAATPQSILVGA